jgi:putative glutamine amidotransferase
LRPIVLSTSREEKSRTYAEALSAVGVPSHELRVAVADGSDAANAAEAAGHALDGAAALVLCGGEDIEPWRFGEQPWNDTLHTNPNRDAFEFALLEAAAERQIPTFGVCRGLQVLNVHFGGSLWQDLPSQRPGAVAHNVTKPLSARAHALVVEAVDHPFATRLEESIALEPEVNSRHHQAVKQLGRHLQVTSRSPDGLVESFVRPFATGWWLAAVQWHPEDLVSTSAGQRALWQAFVDRARRPLAGP